MIVDNNINERKNRRIQCNIDFQYHLSFSSLLALDKIIECYSFPKYIEIFVQIQCFKKKLQFFMSFSGKVSIIKS